MHQKAGYFLSTIGSKYLMAITGLAWSLFVMAHMLGNMLILVGPEAYNRYGHALVSNPIIYVVEFALLVFILTHVFKAFALKSRNMRTKPMTYAIEATNREKATKLSTRTMIFTGSLMLAFLIWHLITFKFGPHYTVVYDDLEMRDLYKLIVERFSSPYYCFFYGLSMIFVGIHLFHGFKSSFQTLGINHPRYNGFIKYFGYSYAVIVSVGFFIQPVYVYLVR